MQRKQQVGECWVCVILFARVVVSECMCRATGGLEGGMCHVFRWFFWHMVFADGFLFLVKELGFWTNPGHWVRVLDVAGSYMYIVL
jgi:hypothetical protein